MKNQSTHTLWSSSPKNWPTQNNQLSPHLQAPSDLSKKSKNRQKKLLISPSISFHFNSIFFYLVVPIYSQHFLSLVLLSLFLSHSPTKKEMFISLNLFDFDLDYGFYVKGGQQYTYVYACIKVLCLMEWRLIESWNNWWDRLVGILLLNLLIF